MRLIAQMVVKNEAERFLIPVLEDLITYVDEIVVTDDCSDDDTVEIAQAYTNHVYTSKTSLFETDEGALRQNAWRNLEKHATLGDWILCIDADEIVWPTKAPVTTLIGDPRVDVIGLEFINMWTPTQYRVDKMWAPQICTKLFRYVKGGSIRDRKLACGSEPTYVERAVRVKRWMPNSGLKIQHLGYIRDEDKKAKYDRYMAIDGGKYHNGAHLKSIMDKEVQLKTWEFQKV